MFEIWIFPNISEYFLEKSVEISQNIKNHWQLGSPEVRRKIQK